MRTPRDRGPSWQTWGSPRSTPTIVPEIFRVTPHLYKFNRAGEGSNFGIIVSDGGRAIMVDCGLMSADYLDRALKGMEEHLGLERIDGRFGCRWLRRRW